MLDILELSRLLKVSLKEIVREDIFFENRTLSLFSPVLNKKFNFTVVLMDNHTSYMVSFEVKKDIPFLHKDFIQPMLGGTLKKLKETINKTGDKKYLLDLRKSPLNASGHSSVFEHSEVWGKTVINFYSWSKILTK